MADALSVALSVELARRHADGRAADAGASELLHCFWRQFFREQQLSLESWQRFAGASRAGGLMRILDSSLHDPDFSVAAWAAEAGVCPSTLRNLLQERYGLAPIDLLQRRRLALAGNLLRRSDQPIAQVAAASGYRTVNYFYKVFRQHYQTTPAHFRQTIPV